MDEAQDLGDKQPLDKLSDGDAAGVADRGQGPVHIGIELRAYVLALKAQAARSTRASADASTAREPLYADGSKRSSP